MKNMVTKSGSFAIAKLQAKTRSVLAIALVAVIGFTVSGCKEDDGGGGDPSNGTAIPLTVNKWADSNLPREGVQWFKFTATATEQWIHVLGFSLWVQVFDSSGAMVGFENIVSSSSNYISRTLTSGQTYYIRVRPYGSGSGTYWIAFNTSTDKPPVELPSNAIPLTENQWANGNLPTSNDVQWFKFTATASTQYIHFEFGTLTYLFFQVYDSSGTAVGGDEGWSGSTNNKVTISRTLTSGDTYYIRVRAWGGYSGTYKIAFNTSETAPTSP